MTNNSLSSLDSVSGLQDLLGRGSSLEPFYRGKRILVTGGAGFVGSNIVQQLSHLGAKITVIDNFHPDYGAHEFNLDGLTSSVELVRGDITDQKLMMSLVERSDLVFHAAAQCSHVDSMIDPWLDLQFNCQGTLSLLEAAKSRRKATGEKVGIVYVSTRAAIGAPLTSPATEMTLPNPVDTYGVNKLAAEYYGAVYARVFQIPYVALRLTNSYGPRHQMRHGKYGILNWFMSLALQGLPIKVYGTGSQLRDYLYIDDAVDAVLRAGVYSSILSLEGNPSHTASSVQDESFARHQGTKADQTHRIAGQNIPYAVFNIASGRPEKFVDCTKAIVEQVPGSSLEMIPWPADRAAIETGDYIATCEAAQKVLQWQPRTSFKEGLAKTLAFYRTHLPLYLKRS